MIERVNVFKHDPTAWEEGFKAGEGRVCSSIFRRRLHVPIRCPYPAGTGQAWSWCSGYVEGDAKRQGYSYGKSGIVALRNAGERVITRDKDLANAHRHVKQLIQDSPKKSRAQLFAENNPVVADADLTGASSAAEVTEVHQQGNEVVSNEMFFRIRIPNAALRKYVTQMLGRMLDEDEDVTLDVETLGKLEVPANLEAVAVAIDQMQSTDPASAFQDAQMDLDRVVAGLFDMSEDDLTYITSAMTNDGFLKQLKPSLEHRGLRIQPYADHSQGDRYA